MGVNFILIYGERAPVVHNRNQLERFMDFYGITIFEDMEFEVYTDGYGNMKALFKGGYENADLD